MFFAIYSSMCDFLYWLILCLANLLRSLYIVLVCYLVFWYVPLDILDICLFHLQIKIDLSLPIWMPCTFFHLVVLVRTPNVMMDRSYESRHHFPIFSIWEEKWSFSTQLLALGFSLVPFTGLRKLPFIHFTGRFYQD